MYIKQSTANKIREHFCTKSWHLNSILTYLSLINLILKTRTIRVRIIPIEQNIIPVMKINQSCSIVTEAVMSAYVSLVYVWSVFFWHCKLGRRRQRAWYNVYNAYGWRPHHITAYCVIPLCKYTQDRKTIIPLITHSMNRVFVWANSKSNYYWMPTIYKPGLAQVN